MTFLLSLIGLLLVIEGIPYFVFPDKMKEFMSKIPQIPSNNLRIFGIIAIIVGLSLIFVSRRLMG